MKTISTIEEARKRTYGFYGAPYTEGCCVEHISAKDGSTHQCIHKAVAGPSNLYCRRHDPIAIKAKDKARSEKANAELDAKNKSTMAAHELAQMQALVCQGLTFEELQSLGENYLRRHLDKLV